MSGVIKEQMTGRSRHRWQPAGFRGQRGYLVLQVEVHRTYDISGPNDPGATSEGTEWIDARPEHLTVTGLIKRSEA